MKHRVILATLTAPWMILGGSLLAHNAASSHSTTSPTGEKAVTTVTTTDEDHQVQQVHAVSLDFAPGSSQLGQAEKEKIRQGLTVDPTQNNIKVAVWADKAWAADMKQDTFTKQDKQLAKDRGEQIKEYVKQIFPKKDVELVAMTEAPGFFAKVFRTDEAEIKSIFAKKGAEADRQEAAQNPEAVVVREQGGPGKAVVIVAKKS